MQAKLKVVLFNPDAVFFDMPLALLAIGSALDPAKYEVVIVDARIEKNYTKRLLTELENAVCLGITVLTGNPLNSALEVSLLAKNANPEVPVIWGGWHTSIFPKQTLHDVNAVDITVQRRRRNF